jgi:ribosomal protein S18 acetylase RimI-like enzyme
VREPLTGEVARDDGGPASVELDPATMRALALHEARAHALVGRRVVDLGDAILLHDPRDDDPFWNRLSGLRLPEDPEAFRRRLDVLIAMFAGLGRDPHVWASPLHDTPADLPARLEARGFVDLGRGLTMILADPSRAVAHSDLAARVVLERHNRPPAADRERLASEVAALLVAAFRVDPLARLGLATDLEASFEAPELTLYVARVGETPVAVAKRATFDGATYLSSIGTRPGWQGRGLGTLVTVAAVRDGLAEGTGITYLGVFDDNRRARGLYERLGFATVGSAAGDFLRP